MRYLLITLLPFLLLTACNRTQTETLPEVTVYKNNSHYEAKQQPKQTYEVTKPEDQWREELSPEQYRVLRGKGTEKPGSGEYDEHFEKGYYTCGACGAKLFSSNTKFDAHCGWPSFFAPEDSAAIEYVMDYSHGMVRTEVLCSRCGGHLGHVFEDGPEPTGQRYCINSVSLGFVPLVEDTVAKP